MNPLVKAFAYNPLPHDRKEALPLCLAALAAWESHVVSPSCPPAVGLLLGAMLLCAHCSLRFGNASGPRPFPSPRTLLGHQDHQPRPAQPFGFLGRQVALSDEFDPDFILPCVPDLESPDCPSLARPMSYLQAIVCLRWAIHLPRQPGGRQLVTKEEANGFTLHCLKSSLLSAAATLRLPKESDDCKATIASHRHCCTAAMTLSKPCGCKHSCPQRCVRAGARLALWPKGGSTRAGLSDAERLGARGNGPQKPSRLPYQIPPPA